MKFLIQPFDTLSEWVGKVCHWLVTVLVLLVAYGVFLRFVLNQPNLWTYETSIMLGAAIFVLATAYVHRHDGHIRVDIIYEHLSPRKKAIIDTIGHLILFFPAVGFAAYASVTWTIDAWVTGEVMTETGWYPPAAPLRTIVAFGFVALFLQGIPNFLRAAQVAIKGEYHA